MNERHLSIRAAAAADAPAIAEIYNESILAGDATTDEEQKTAAYFTEQMLSFNNREAILILQDGGVIAGWGIIKRYSDRPGYRFCCETAVYLRRQLLRRGYGSFMKKAIIARCRAMGYHHLVAKIFADNIASIKYNEKLGYELVGRQREVAYKDGRWRDVVIMQLILSDVPPDIPARYQ